MSRDPQPPEGELGSLRNLTGLKRHVRTKLSTNHPLRIAVEALPDTVSAEDFRVHLRILLPLARLEGA